MQAFIFQSRLDRFDLRSELTPGRKDTWLATRYQHAMRTRDIVYLWLAGPQEIRGLYGWGRIDGRPRMRGGESVVDVKVEVVFAAPLLAVDIRQVPGVAELLIFKAPQASNFLLSSDEAKRLATLISQRGERAPRESALRPTSVSQAAHRRRRVFVSYSSRDRQWLQRLQVHLAPLERSQRQLLWDDSRIAPGQVWKREIEQAMAAAKVAVLLVSADFLASEFIMDNELPRLLAAAADEGAVILPVIISPCRFRETRSLASFQAVNSALRPLCAMNDFEREDTLYRVSIAVEGALNRSTRGHD